MQHLFFGQQSAPFPNSRLTDSAKSGSSLVPYPTKRLQIFQVLTIKKGDKAPLAHEETAKGPTPLCSTPSTSEKGAPLTDKATPLTLRPAQPVAYQSVLA